MEFLYRGVNNDLYYKLNGRLVPKEAGMDFEAAAECGAPHCVSGAIRCGTSIHNCVLMGLSPPEVVIEVTENQ